MERFAKGEEFFIKLFEQVRNHLEKTLFPKEKQKVLTFKYTSNEDTLKIAYQYGDSWLLKFELKQNPDNQKYYLKQLNKVANADRIWVAIAAVLENVKNVKIDLKREGEVLVFTIKRKSENLQLPSRALAASQKNTKVIALYLLKKNL